MLVGDNWIGQVSGAVMNGPEWQSTALFIAYDDCGCFYDHVPPPPGFGIRVPMVIVSPYAIAGYTDSTTAPFASMLAYIEHTFGLAPLSSEDANAYDFGNSFNYGQRPVGPIRMTQHHVPGWELRWIRQHPADPNDPT
jgi:phospholipase C